jgi:two-component system nitrogen regulation response regulator GlnG
MNERVTRSLRVLIAEDDAAMRDVMEEALASRGHRVASCATGLALLARLEAAIVGADTMPDVIVTDDRMPGARGSDVLASLHDDGAPLRVVLISAFAGEELQRRARDLGAVLLDKPFEAEELVYAVERLAEEG